MGGGVGIAVIADIARDRRDRKTRSRGRLRSTVIAETHANLGGLGMGSYKPFGILVEGWGEG